MIRNGVDCLKAYDAVLRGKRLGLITSVSGVDLRMQSTIDCLAESYTLVKLFSPEHGVRGNVGAGEEVETYEDLYVHIPVYSLYRKSSKKLSEEMLCGVDMIVYDIQDVGTRYYTFISTMYYAMQACEKYKKEFLVLDRCNPLGDVVEGNLLSKENTSFVGAYPVCMRYGLTPGELAGMIYKEEKFHFPFTVVPLEGWHRKMLFNQLGNVWVMPSPGLPRFETALLYPGTCLFEGTNLSEGRGTAAPFEIIGAPYVDAYYFTRFINDKKIQGVIFTPVYFTPFCSKYVGTECQGVHIHITDRKRFNPTETGLRLLFAFREYYPEKFQFLEPQKAEGRRGIELLFGNKKILEDNVSCEELIEDYRRDSENFYERKKKYHLYD